MNCKPGDLAVLVRSDAGNEGKIVTCVKYVGFVPTWRYNDLWEIDRGLLDNFGEISKYASDSCLKPLRGGEGEDEMIRIAGKSQKEIA